MLNIHLLNFACLTVLLVELRFCGWCHPCQRLKTINVLLEKELVLFCVIPGGSIKRQALQYYILYILLQILSVQVFLHCNKVLYHKTIWLNKKNKNHVYFNYSINPICGYYTSYSRDSVDKIPQKFQFIFRF